MRVRVASGVLRGSPSIQGNTLPVECGFIQHVGEGGEEWWGGPLWSPAVPLKRRSVSGTQADSP
jgi:hypothetical protein